MRGVHSHGNSRTSGPHTNLILSISSFFAGKRKAFWRAWGLVILVQTTVFMLLSALTRSSDAHSLLALLAFLLSTLLWCVQGGQSLVILGGREVNPL